MKNNQPKKVSLVLTTFNCADNLEKTLQSIEKQDYPDIEIVIGDDASRDYEEKQPALSAYIEVNSPWS